MAAVDTIQAIFERAEDGDEAWLSKSANANNDDLRAALDERGLSYISRDTKKVLVSKLLESFKGRRKRRQVSPQVPRCPHSPDQSKKYGYTGEFWTKDCVQYYYLEGDEGYGSCARCARASSPSTLVRCPPELVAYRNEQGANLQNGKDYTFYPSCSSDDLADDGSSESFSGASQVGISLLVPYAAPYFIAKNILSPSAREEIEERPDDGRCEGTTAKGGRCKNKAKYDGYCHLHRN